MGSYTPPSYGSYYAYYSDDDAGNGTVNYNEELISPAIAIPSNAEDLDIEYGYGFRVYQAGEIYNVRARFFTGSWGSWQTIATYTSSTSGTATIDLSSYLPADSVQFEWMYHDESASSNWGYGAACDNIFVTYSYSLSNDEGSMTSVGVFFNDLSSTCTRAHWGDAVIRKASGGDSINVQFEYYTGTWQLVPNGELPGNSAGFYSTSALDTIDLTGLDTTTYNTLRMIASFYRIVSEAPDDPCLLDWEIGNNSNYIGIAENKTGISVMNPMLTVFPSVSKNHLNIAFSAGRPGADIDLKIYDASGRIVRSFSPVQSENTTQQIVWNRQDDRGRAVAAGVYFVQLMTDDYEKVVKAILLR
jgi:hypothetical protein